MTTEKVLVVPTKYLNVTGPYTKPQEHLDALNHHWHFAPRESAETDPSLKQLIPYVTIVNKEEFLCLERTQGQSEKRLHGKLSLGVGGHINPQDQGQDLFDTINNAMKRELTEELWVNPPNQGTLIGIINDDSNPVGAVHLGLHHIIAVEIKPTVREKDKMQASWQTYSELSSLRHRLETWSQILLPFLSSQSDL